MDRLDTDCLRLSCRLLAHIRNGLSAQPYVRSWMMALFLHARPSSGSCRAREGVATYLSLLCDNTGKHPLSWDFAQTMKAPTWDVFAREALVLFEAAPDKVWRKKALSAMHERMLIDCIPAMATVLQVRYTARWSHSKGRLVLKVTDDKHVCARLRLHPVARGIRILLSDLLSTFSSSV